MPYRVLLDIKGKWWSDQLPLPTLSAAQKHRRSVAERWNDCGTIIETPDGRLVLFHESLQYQKELAQIRAGKD